MSLDSARGSRGVVDAQSTDNGLAPVEGTSFAAPYVAGLAALVRARFPDLSAAEVMARITRTAHAPGTGRDNTVGHGVVDPVAALTYQLPPEDTDWTASQAIPKPTQPPTPDHSARTVALVGGGICATVLVAGWAVSLPARRLRRLEPDEY
jgi:membrane-anchored mycosin MYCP